MHVEAGVPTAVISMHGQACSHSSQAQPTWQVPRLSTAKYWSQPVHLQSVGE